MRCSRPWRFRAPRPTGSFARAATRTVPEPMGAGDEARLQLLRDRAALPGGLQVTCVGSSMEPVIRRGDRVTVRVQRPGVGMVAAFMTREGELELHRLIAAAPKGWWAHLGDNQVSRTPGLVHGSRIVGIADVPIV